ncbi:hypothetical protein BGY98DRAFT_985869 [Russula aff. rugulosa BPL654]|nr:hypothetical protein BGY98DRAFT_985869 [Russula aff. rugulosa BPL654]
MKLLPLPTNSQYLPSPHNLDLPIVKLLSHPIYHSSVPHPLSLFPRVYLSYVPRI